MSEKIDVGNLLLPENRKIAFNIFVREATGGRCGNGIRLSKLSHEVRKAISDLAIVESRMRSPKLILLFYIGTLTGVMQKGHKTFLVKGINRRIRKFDSMLTIVPSRWRWERDGCHEIDCFIRLSVCPCDMERQVREGVKQINRAIRLSGIGIPLHLPEAPLNLKICQCGHLMLDGWEECIHCDENREYL